MVAKLTPLNNAAGREGVGAVINACPTSIFVEITEYIVR